MIFADLKDKFIEQFKNIKDKVEENSTYNQIKERYENLDQRIQRTVIVSIILMILFFIYSIPYSSFSTSWAQLNEFEEKKELIRELFRVTRSQTNDEGLPVSASFLDGRVRDILTKAGIQKSQIANQSALSSDQNSLLASPQINQTGVVLKLKSLTLKEVVDIGQKLQNIDSQTKLVDFSADVNSKSDHYFDVMFKLIKFSVKASEFQQEDGLDFSLEETPKKDIKNLKDEKSDSKNSHEGTKKNSKDK